MRESVKCAYFVYTSLNKFSAFVQVFIRPSKWWWPWMIKITGKIQGLWVRIRLRAQIVHGTVGVSVIFKTNKVLRDASGWVKVESGSAKLSLILGSILDSLWLRCNNTVHNDAPLDVMRNMKFIALIHCYGRGVFIDNSIHPYSSFVFRRHAPLFRWIISLRVNVKSNISITILPHSRVSLK